MNVALFREKKNLPRDQTSGREEDYHSRQRREEETIVEREGSGLGTRGMEGKMDLCLEAKYGDKDVYGLN